jgi:hypothetical protein
MRRAWLIAAAGLLAGAAPAGAEQFQSGPTRTALIELYTSEGCSSCPPAEAWFSSLLTAPGLWHTVVPVAFHVTYWDNGGWRDRWASPAFTRRQYAYAAAWNEPQVYTPCFVVNGREWQPATQPLAWRGGPGGMLTVDVHDSQVIVHYDPPKPGNGRRLTACVALLGMGLHSHVLAGENEGATLAHDFIAVDLQEAPLRAGEATLQVHPDRAPGRCALAAWITERGSLTPLQAAGGWLRRH